MNLPTDSLNRLAQLNGASAQSHPLMSPLLAVICIIGFILAPVIHSAGTGTSASQASIPLFDPANYTVDQLHFNTLNDGIPDVWKLHYGLSTTDPSVANADYNSSGMTNVEKYQFNLQPFAPSTPPAPQPKAKTKSSKPSVATTLAGLRPQPFLFKTVILTI